MGVREAKKEFKMIELFLETKSAIDSVGRQWNTFSCQSCWHSYLVIVTQWTVNRIEVRVNKLSDTMANLFTFSLTGFSQNVHLLLSFVFPGFKYASNSFILFDHLLLTHDHPQRHVNVSKIHITDRIRHPSAA